MGFEPILDPTGSLVKMIVRTCVLSFSFSLGLISDQGPEVGMSTALNQTRTVGRPGSWPPVKLGVPDRD